MEILAKNESSFSLSDAEFEGANVKFGEAELGISPFLYDRTLLPAVVSPGQLISTVFHIPTSALLSWTSSRAEMVQFQASFSLLRQMTLYDVARMEEADRNKPGKKVNKLGYKETNSTLALKAIKIRKAHEENREIDEASFQAEKPKIQSLYAPYLTKELMDLSQELGLSESINRSRALIRVSIEVTKRILLGWSFAQTSL